MPRYTTLESVQQNLRVPKTTSGDYAPGGEFRTTIMSCIDAAEQLIDDHCGRTFDAAGTESETRRFQGSGSDVLLTDDFLELTRVNVDTEDGNEVEAGRWKVELPAMGNRPSRHLRYYYGTPAWARTYGYEVDTLLGGVGGWQRDVDYYLTGRWGWPSVPHPVQLAASLAASRYFHRLNTPLGVMDMGDMGGMYVPRLDGDVQRLLRPYCTGGFAGR